ncbi:MAG: hypothetical protein A2157_10900 [Deltaproteobacteria bacterium RBG_16_47_11]|nr:MAG: hypothetical protein A2157_10900 [Deltaproteobacteria bacterium RBG_16_47_11]
MNENLCKECLRMKRQEKVTMEIRSKARGPMEDISFSLNLAAKKGRRPNFPITLVLSMKLGNTLNKDPSSNNSLNKGKRGKSLR